MSKPIIERASEWLLSDDTGRSSKALCAHMLGMPTNNHPPSDRDDRGRCIRLLNKVPEWWHRLDEMKSYKDKESLVFSSKGMVTDRNGWAAQIPLIREEANVAPPQEARS